MKSLIRVLDLILALILFAVVVTVMVMDNPTGVSFADYVSRQQAMIRMLNTPMPILGAVTILLALISAGLHWSQSRSRWFWILGALFLIVSGLITRFLNQPINAMVMTWTSSAPPADWEALRDKWWQWHLARTTIIALGFVSLLAASLASRCSSSDGSTIRS